MCLIKQRAKNPAQKALRRQQILAATRKHFEELCYEDVSLKQIASEVGITKAALYRYFRNKETLFLALFVETLEELVTAAEQEMHHASLARVMSNTLLKNPVYCKLSAILHTILERNLTLEEAREFKHILLDITGRYATLLRQHNAFPSDASLTGAVALLMQVQQALIGVWHMTHPIGAIATVIETAPLDIFRQDFAEALHSHIEKLVATVE